MTAKTLYSVDAPHFNAGLVVEREVVLEAAPILKWSIGKPVAEVFRFFAAKGWKVTECE